MERGKRNASNMLGTYCLMTKRLHLCNILVASQMFGRYYGYLQVKETETVSKRCKELPHRQHSAREQKAGEVGGSWQLVGCTSQPQVKKSGGYKSSFTTGQG